MCVSPSFAVVFHCWCRKPLFYILQLHHLLRWSAGVKEGQRLWRTASKERGDRKEVTDRINWETAGPHPNQHTHTRTHTLSTDKPPKGDFLTPCPSFTNWLVGQIHIWSTFTPAWKSSIRPALWASPREALHSHTVKETVPDGAARRYDINLWWLALNFGIHFQILISKYYDCHIFWGRSATVWERKSYSYRGLWAERQRRLGRWTQMGDDLKRSSTCSVLIRRLMCFRETLQEEMEHRSSKTHPPHLVFWWKHISPESARGVQMWCVRP